MQSIRNSKAGPCGFCCSWFSFILSLASQSIIKMPADGCDVSKVNEWGEAGLLFAPSCHRPVYSESPLNSVTIQLLQSGKCKQNLAPGVS